MGGHLVDAHGKGRAGEAGAGECADGAPALALTFGRAFEDDAVLLDPDADVLPQETLVSSPTGAGGHQPYWNIALRGG